ncbi:MAG TPA: hypothetical protein VMY77_05325 [Chitinophagaceae bacterium]|nr:hypothetical protein [Chitinophagaceae bacterium]
METHHPHHVTHKKKWTEYMLEFFMLFLAVFLGFVTENVRENYVERHREKEYIKSELNDLRSDTAEFRRIISRYQLKVLQMDTLIVLLHSPDQQAHLNEIYFLGRVSSFTPRFTYNDGTIQQLKNAGGLRLIKHKGVPDSIMIYDARINEIRSQGEVLSEAARDYRNQANKIFDPYIFYQILKGTLASAQRPLNSPSLLSYDAEKINDVISQVMYLRSIFLVTLEMCRSTKALATRLIVVLQKEYHLY